MLYIIFTGKSDLRGCKSKTQINKEIENNLYDHSLTFACCWRLLKQSWDFHCKANTLYKSHLNSPSRRLNF